MDFEVRRCTRKCAETDQPLLPGDVFYSVLIPEGADVVRKDYHQHAWKGAPDNAIGWWQAVVPDPATSKVQWAPHDVILNYFKELEGRSDRLDERYVLALLMIRRRIVRLEETHKDEVTGEALTVYCPKDEQEYEVKVEHPPAERVELIQRQLAELLFAAVDPAADAAADPAAEEHLES